jgi:translation initiation factor IF-3
MPPRQAQPATKGPQLLTDKIRAREVRLIDGDDNRIIPRAEAEMLSRERGLDLLIVSLESDPPVVRLVDYGRFKFEAEKKAREAKRKQHVIEIKEIKMGVRIDDHDYNVKLSHAVKFLQDGNKVKLSIRLKGREIQHSELAIALGKRFIVDCEAYGTLEGQLRMEGRTITINLAPNKTA